jgi:hypothetical protein
VAITIAAIAFIGWIPTGRRYTAAVTSADTPKPTSRPVASKWRTTSTPRIRGRKVPRSAKAPETSPSTLSSRVGRVLRSSGGRGASASACAFFMVVMPFGATGFAHGSPASLMPVESVRLPGRSDFQSRPGSCCP